MIYLLLIYNLHADYIGNGYDIIYPYDCIPFFAKYTPSVCGMMIIHFSSDFFGTICEFVNPHRFAKEAIITILKQLGYTICQNYSIKPFKFDIFFRNYNDFNDYIFAIDISNGKIGLIVSDDLYVLDMNVKGYTNDISPDIRDLFNRFKKDFKLDKEFNSILFYAGC